MKKKIFGCLSSAFLVGVAMIGFAGQSADRGDADMKAVVAGNNQFALDLYAKLQQQDKNLFFSPYSLSSALAMTSAGARGETARQMAQTLHFTIAPPQLHATYLHLLRQLDGGDTPRSYQLSVANALWGQKGYHFLPSFLELTQANYGAGLNEVDFAHQTENARITINTWVEKQTHDKIKELLKQGVLTDGTRLVLTNAVYFKGDWEKQFPEQATRDEDFHTTASQKVSAPVMKQKDAFNYYDGGSFQAIELPYIGKELSMVVFLPKEVEGLTAFEKTLTHENLSAWFGKLRNTPEINVSFPKFKVTAEFSLKPILSALGMPLAFDATKADFSGMNGRHDLYITAVAHKAFVEVDEKGTEAAAATGIVVVTTAFHPQVMFHADHPFVFLIRDNRTGSILFLGKVINPKQTE